MRSRLVAGVALLVLGSSLAAQGVAEMLDAVAAKIEAKDWDAAATLLLAMDAGSAEVAERQRLAAQLSEVGRGLQDVAPIQRALKLHETGLRVLRGLHGERAHRDVARSLNNVAGCLQSMGRAGEALPQFEQALAMRRRLFGDRDHPDVAAGLNNVAGCLQSLGRAGEALPQFEQALAMWRRLFGDRDHPDVAAGLNNVAGCLQSMGRAGEALPQFEQALAMWKRLIGDGDHPGVANSLFSVAGCLESLGRAGEALPEYEKALAMWRRLCGDREHPRVALGIHGVAGCLRSLGRGGEALLHYEQALAMWRRLFGDRDHPDVAVGLSNVAFLLESLGRAGEALPHCEEALAMWRRLFGDRDHPDVATGLNQVATCLRSLGRVGEALPPYEQALAMRMRLFGDRDHPDVANSLNNVASCLLSVGRADEALPRYEQALAMRKRLFGDRDHPDLARSLNNVASCLLSVGRADEALPQCEQALAMWRRLFGDGDHPDVTFGLNNLAGCLYSLGRAGEALSQLEQALAMRKRLFGDHDHPDVAFGLNSVASCLLSMGRADEALPQCEQALAMSRRLFDDRDHPDVTFGLNMVAGCLYSLGRAGEALPQYEQALAMRKRLFGDRDHPDVARSLNNLAGCLSSLGRAGEALAHVEQALAMWKHLHGDRDHPDLATGLNNAAACLQSLGRAGEAQAASVLACEVIDRLRAGSRVSGGVQQSYFDELKRGGAFERLQSLACVTDAPLAFTAAERSRGRDLLDVLEQLRADPLHEAEQRAMQHDDEVGAAKFRQLRVDLAGAEVEGDRLLHLLTRLADAALPEAERDTQRRTLLAQSDANSQRRRQLLDERARLLADVLPVGRVRSAAEIQTTMRDDELLLEYTVTADVALVYVLASKGAVAAIPLPTAFVTAERVLPALLTASTRGAIEPQRGRDPETWAARGDVSAPARELFQALVPPAVWERIRTSKRVFVAAHRSLHRLPFEMLVTEVKDGKPVRWLENGPPIAYVPSGSALHWLRTRRSDGGIAGLDFVAVGDPNPGPAEPDLPEQGALVVQVVPGSQAERLGLQVRDVLVSYDGQPIADQPALGALRQTLDQAIAAGTRQPGPIPLEVWRTGELLRFQLQPGAIGVQLALLTPRVAYEGTLPGDEQLARIMRAGDLDRVRQLPRLQGAAEEAKAIAAAFRDRDGRVELRLGADATEPAVFDLAAKAKYLHFACHGIAEEYAGQSLSMLVLSPPRQVLPGDDGLLKLGDLLHAWRGRLASCRLVVLSACRTNVGPTLRDEAPQALPIGFLFAGAPAVISSLWAVDDASTKELMTDFYSRLLAGETDQLAAFTAAKCALARKHPDPFHWAPFLYMGSPE